MKPIAELLIIVTVVSFVNCSNKTTMINGHWHSANPEIGSFNTLDISDSVIITNKFQIDGLRPQVYNRRKENSGKLILPFQDYMVTAKYRMVNDSLEIGKRVFAYKYIRSSLKSCVMRDRYIRSAIKISLPTLPQAENYDDLYFNSFCEDLFIGRLSEESFFDKTSNHQLSKNYPDSIFMQDGDVFRRIEQLPRWYKEIRSKWDKEETPNVVFHVDEEVPETILNRILAEIPKSCNVYKAVKKSDGDLGVVKILRN